MPSPYRPFSATDAVTPSATGWDAWAEEYARLPETSPTYRFSKRLLHDVLDEEIAGRAGLDVLDFNCGCGNDFDYFLAGGHRLVGCDGSVGMLGVAARRFAEAVRSRAVSLFLGDAERLTADALGGRRFDLILSATGGTAYLDDDELLHAHRALRGLSKPGGRMVITHLAPRCLTETLYHLGRLRPRAALRRWRSTIEISVKSQALTMHLRSARHLRRILAGVVPAHRLVPLNVLVPPFQSGFELPDRAHDALLRIERGLQRLPPSLAICDQIAWVARL